MKTSAGRRPQQTHGQAQGRSGADLWPGSVRCRHSRGAPGQAHGEPCATDKLADIASAVADFLSGSTAEEDIEGDEEDKQEEVAHDMLKLQTCGHHGVWHSMMLSGTWMRRVTGLGNASVASL